MYAEVDHALATSSPAGFAHVTSGGRWIPYEHLILLNDYLLRVAAGECPRLIVTMPPRHGKSELISKYFPAWYLGRFPDRQVIMTSYEAGFAASWGGKSRDLLAEHAGMFGVRVSDSSSAKDLWRIEGREGIMATAGVGGAITGKGAHLAIIDDPIKNSEEAQSKTIRDKQWDWWLSTMRTRLMPGSTDHPPGAVILVMTRWHEDDLAGRLIKHAAEGGDKWEVLNLQAIAGDDDALDREPGEALCPELFDAAALEATRRALGTYWWSAMYQQSPSPAAGLLFKREHFRYYEVRPSADGQPFLWLYDLDGSSRSVDVGKCRKFQIVDVAASEKKTADFTVVSTILQTPSMDMVIWAMAARRFDLLQVPSFIKGEWEREGRPPLHIEEFGHGMGPAKTLRNLGVPVHKLEPIGDKITRAMDAVARYEAHTVFHPRVAEWLPDLEDELVSFPNGSHDDRVDTVSYGSIKLGSLGGVSSVRVVRAQPKQRTPRW